MNRVAILGSAGSGKSTLAKQLGGRHHIEVVHMDRLFWKPGWIMSTQAELAAKQKVHLGKPSWIIEGNYSGVWDERLALADTVIMLDLNRYLCLLRILKRWLLNKGKSREDMAPGCSERMSLEFIKYVWNYPTKKRSHVMSSALEQANHAQIVILPSKKSVKKFLCQNICT
ncbi:topology modulation protein [Halobacillus sp. A1]|uniref:topology modulation protein n=1 Tax=Halobacillus sp. A1 TaxID=2880262 RepID=UPI0020A632C1|nr:topology modulation protein [Halobacillus sp. A1]MCP3030779.1 topology modulation protein [Halobacillus sp. A1]